MIYCLCLVCLFSFSVLISRLTSQQRKGRDTVADVCVIRRCLNPVCSLINKRQGAPERKGRKQRQVKNVVLSADSAHQVLRRLPPLFQNYFLAEKEKFLKRVSTLPETKFGSTKINFKFKFPNSSRPLPSSSLVVLFVLVLSSVRLFLCCRRVVVSYSSRHRAT